MRVQLQLHVHEYLVAPWKPSPTIRERERMASGKWLEKALQDLCGRIETGLDLDADLISGLVSFCELAPPPDAADYLTNIIGEKAGQVIIQEYLQKRGYVDSSKNTGDVQQSKFQAYTKPAADEASVSLTKKQTKKPKEAAISTPQNIKNRTETLEPGSTSKRAASVPKKKKAGKTISLAEAAKGSIVFKQGLPCSCQARRHKLVSNCLSCGKIVCEQEGEGPCSFCGALVLSESSTYAGLDDEAVPLSESEATAEAYAKRLVEYDRNSAARTKVIDDQSDYYEIEGNSWLSKEEKELIKQQLEEAKEAEATRKNQVFVTFDLVGRKVIMSKGEASELDSEHRILRPSEERDVGRIKPNPTVKVQPVFVETGPAKKPSKANPAKRKENKRTKNGLCLEISGRVQHDGGEVRRLMSDDPQDGTYDEGSWKGPNATKLSLEEDDSECRLDCN